MSKAIHYTSGHEKILITGGAGYLGSVLVQKLMESKKSARLSYHDPNYEAKVETPSYYKWEKVTVYDNLMYKQTPLTNYCYRGDFEFIQGDVRDQDKLRPLVAEADVIIPLAAIVGFPACEADKELATKVNAEQIDFILEHMKPTCKVIYPNTNSGYGVGESGVHCTEETPLNPLSHYGKTKCAAEDAVLAQEQVAFRLATVFGVSPRMRLDLLVNDFTYKAYKDGYIVLFEWHFNRNYIHVQDVALAFIFAIQNYGFMKGSTYNIGLSEANLTKLELTYKIKEHFPGLSIQCDAIREDPDKRDYIVSNEKIEALGWRPRYDLDDGIRELKKCFAILGPSLNQYTNL
mgnify:FL=1